MNTLNKPARCRHAALGLMLAAALLGLGPRDAAAMKADTPPDSAAAQFELGRRYRDGDGVPVARELALRHFTAAAEKGHAGAEYELWQHHSGRYGGSLDFARALDFAQRSARHGHVPAQVELAFLYFNGNQQVPRDLAQSFQWFRKAAQQRSVIAQCMLGDFYKRGLGGAKQSFAEAVKWYRLTAGADDRCAPRSQFELYLSYESGQGNKRNLQTATTWLKKAADAGHPQAQAALGKNFRAGYGVPQDDHQAKLWLRRSREGASPHDDHDHELRRSFLSPEMERRLGPMLPR